MSTIAIVASPKTYVASLGAMVDAHARLGEAFTANPALGDYARMHTRLHLQSTNGGRITLCGDRTMQADERPDEADDVRLIYLPSFQIANPDRIGEELERFFDFHRWLKAQDSAGVLIGACGSSVLHLAAAGLLQNREAAVHPRLLAPFRRLFPRVAIDALHEVCVSANLMTCGPDAHNAALIIRLFESAFSGSIAGGLALREPTGAQTMARREAVNPIVAQAQIWIRERFARDFRIADLAAELGVSHQALIRHFRLAGVGTPRAFVQRARIDSASSMLVETNRSVSEIAQLVGYVDITFFRRIFRSTTGLSPSAFRKRKRANIEE